MRGIAHLYAGSHLDRHCGREEDERGYLSQRVNKTTTARLGHVDAYHHHQIVVPRNLECPAQIDGYELCTIEKQSISIGIVAIHAQNFIYADFREYCEPRALTTANVCDSLGSKY
jgi:hypothetical protein